jgi:uncharacterized protein (DUF58 family)
MNLTPTDEALAKLCRFRLSRVVHALNPGNNLGDHAGGSLIFQDHRPYFPGDDLRRIDWRAYGRTDTLLLKTYQEEVAPYVEILVDVSVSLAVTPAKQAAVQRWAWFLATVALNDGYTVSLCRLGQDAQPLRPAELAATAWQFAPAASPVPALQRAWRGRYRSVRVILSDFLFDPAAVEQLLAHAARDAMTLFGLQLLDPEEIEPTTRGAYRLLDDDQQTREELVIGDRELQQYRQRFAAHQANLRTGFRRRGGALAVVNAAADTKTQVMSELVPAGILSLS